MDHVELIRTRRSIRKYLPLEITQHTIEQLLEAGMYAPSAKNEQPWHFIVIKNKEKMTDLAEFLPFGKMLPFASVAIMVCADLKLEKSPGYWPIDCAAATQNILLEAHGSGLGAVWLGVYPRPERMEALVRYFDLPESIKPFSIISLGVPDENKTTPERYNPNRIHYEKW